MTRSGFGLLCNSRSLLYLESCRNSNRSDSVKTQTQQFIWDNLGSSKAGGRKIQYDRKRDSVRRMGCGFIGEGLLLLEWCRSVVCTKKCTSLSLSCHHHCMSTCIHTHTFTYTPLLHKLCLLACCAMGTTQLWSFHLTPQQANKHKYTHKLSNTHANSRFT